jgi:hypothetical protein
VTELLRRYLGAYVEGLDREKLKISVWKGDVVLHNLKLKPEALDHLNLPVRVTAGMLGTLRLKVPWHNLGKEPVVAEVDNVFCLARRTRPDGDASNDGDGSGGGGGGGGGDEDDEAAAAEKEKEGSADDAADSEKVDEKRQRVDDAERAWLLLREAAAAGNNNNNKRGGGGGGGGAGGAGAGSADAKQQEKGWLARYGATIIGNLVVTVTNVHIR